MELCLGACVAVLALLLAFALARRRGCACPPGCACGQVRLELRALWREHVDRTHAFVVSTLGALPDADAAAKHLLANQADLGAAFGDAFGADAGEAVTKLLTEHILVAGDLVRALKAGQPTADLAARWGANADAIAAALAGLRPGPWKGAREPLQAHLAGTAAYVQARLEARYADELRLLDDAQEHMAGFADFLAAGWPPGKRCCPRWAKKAPSG